MLADGIAELKIGYFGRDANAADADEPTWRDRWDDRQRLPLLVRLDVKPVRALRGRRSSSSRGESPEAGCACLGPAVAAVLHAACR